MLPSERRVDAPSPGGSGGSEHDQRPLLLLGFAMLLVGGAMVVGLLDGGVQAPTAGTGTPAGEGTQSTTGAAAESAGADVGGADDSDATAGESSTGGTLGATTTGGTPSATFSVVPTGRSASSPTPAESSTATPIATPTPTATPWTSPTPTETDGFIFGDASG